MTLGQTIRALFSPAIRATYQPWDNFWYQQDPAWLSATLSGVPVGPDAMLKVSAMTAGVRVIAETLGMLPFKLFQESEDGGRTPATDDPLYTLLHDQPNPWQTAQQFIEMLTAWAILWGEGVAEIKPGRRRVVGELWPIHPDHIQDVTQASSGRLVYRVRNVRADGTATGEIRTVLQDELFRVSGLGVHRFVPLRLLALAREAVGLWLAMEAHGSRFFSKGATPSLVVETEKSIGATAREKWKEALNAAFSGLSGKHGTLVLDEGAKAKVLGNTAKDAQLLEEREFQVREFARWLRLPHHMLSSEQEPTHASSEVFSQHLVKYTFGPWAARWKQSAQRDLITLPGFFAEFVFDALLMGTTLERYQAHATALAENNGRPFKSVNEVRRAENLPPWPGMDGPPPPKPVTTPAPAPQPEPIPAPSPRDRATAILQESAKRATKREVETIRRQATRKHLADVDGWRTWVEAFYARHAAYLSELLVLPLDLTRGFCRDHRAELLAVGCAVFPRWEAEGPAALLALAQTNGHLAAAAAED
jgi:HK97 family phage portal protein